MKRRSCASMLCSRHAGCFWNVRNEPRSPWEARTAFDGSRTESTDQLVLQVCNTDVETQPFHVDASEVGAEAGPLETAPEHLLLALVTETCQRRVRPFGDEPGQEAPDRLRTPIGTTETLSPS